MILAEVVEGAHVERRVAAHADQERLEHLLLNYRAHEAVVLEAGPGLMPSPPPPYAVHVPQVFCSQTGRSTCTRPVPKPSRALPLGTSSKGKMPTIGRFSVSWTKRNFTPSSVSP